MDRAPPRVSGQRSELEGRPLLQSGLHGEEDPHALERTGDRNCATQRKWAFNAAKSRRAGFAVSPSPRIAHDVCKLETGLAHDPLPLRDRPSTAAGGPASLVWFCGGSDADPLVWKDFVNRLPLPGQLNHAITYGAMCQTDMDGERFEYMCAAEVETFDGLADDLGRMRVPEAHYAVFFHGGPVWSIRETLMAGHDWLASNGEWKDAGTPDFERYGPRFDAATGLGDTEIWFPISHA